jgi:hypothetical protein
MFRGAFLGVSAVRLSERVLKRCLKSAHSESKMLSSGYSSELVSFRVVPEKKSIAGVKPQKEMKPIASIV